MSVIKSFHWRALLGFQLSWFALVIWQAQALLPVLLYWLYGFWCLDKKRRLAVLLITVAGVLLDSVLTMFDVLNFAGSEQLPLWFVMLWALFALAAVEFMASVLTRPWLAALLGASGGPLSYWSGAALSGGALIFPSPQLSLLVLVISWALIAIALGQSRRLYVETP